MSFLDSFSSALPQEISLEYLKQFVPVEWWDEKPEWAAVSALCRCGKFDVQDYLKRYPDVEQTDIDPVLHFVRHGIKENRFFNCMPDTDFGGSRVNLAYKAFMNGEYEKALKLYEDLGERIGIENFSANIAICKKKLGSKESAKLLAQNIKSRPKVSVIIPVYNNAQYLHECIDSVINQTLKDIEIIIINDGSTDPEAVKILNEYAAKDRRIKLIHKENTGYGHSMNVGLDNATGEYVGIVESDDYIDTMMYSILYNKAKKYNLEIIKSNITSFVGCKKSRQFTKYDLSHKNNQEKILYPSKNINHFDFNGFLAIWSGLYSLEFLKKENLKFTETPGASYQDIAFWFISICKSKNYYFAENNLYYVRRDNDQSSVHDSKKLFPVCYEYMKIKKFITTNRYNEFLEFYIKRMFLSYKWCLERAHKDLRQSFLERFTADFLELEYSRKLKLTLFDDNEKKYLNEILKNRYKNKIACIYTSHLAYGGLEKTACDLSIVLKELGYSVFFILIYPEKITYDYYGEVLLKDMKSPIVKKILNDSEVIFDYKFKDRLRDDELVKYCIENFSNKYICTVHNEKERCEYYFNIVYKYLKHYNKNIKNIACVSKQVEKSIIERYGYNNNIIILNNMVNISEIQRILNMHISTKKFNYILFAGRLDATHVKGIDILVPAFLNSSTSDTTKLVIAGNGELHKDIKDIISVHPKRHMIECVGFVDLINDGWLKNCNYLVMPSRYEGFSMLLIEALACNIPVITSSAGGALEVINSRSNGYIIHSYSIEELSEAIDYMSQNYIEMKKNCIDSIKKFDKDQYKLKISQLLNNTIDFTKPLISVVIPIYNAEKFIHECICSVLNQNIENFEILCIDDGSTDRSSEIIKSIDDNRIKYIYQENKGSGHARNKGIYLARGEFIAFLDADDKIPHPYSYKVLYDNAKRHNLPISGGNLYYLTPEGKIVNNKNKEMIFSQNSIINYYDWQYDFCYQNFIYSKDFLENHKLEFPNYKRYQDPVFFVKAMHTAKQFCVINEYSYCYRVRGNKKDWAWTEEMCIGFLNGIFDNLKFSESNNLHILYTNTAKHYEIFKDKIHPYINEKNLLILKLYDSIQKYIN